MWTSDLTDLVFCYLVLSGKIGTVKAGSQHRLVYPSGDGLMQAVYSLQSACVESSTLRGGGLYLGETITFVAIHTGLKIPVRYCVLH